MAPNRSPSQPVMGIATASTRMKALTLSTAVEMGWSKSSAMALRGTLMMLFDMVPEHGHAKQQDLGQRSRSGRWVHAHRRRPPLLVAGGAVSSSSRGARSHGRCERARAQNPRTAPPSTRTTDPVTNDALAEQRKATTSASSSGVPIRPSGISRRWSSRTSSGLRSPRRCGPARSVAGLRCRTAPSPPR